MTLQGTHAAIVSSEAYQAVAAVQAYASTNVDPPLLELVKLRASILNGCAYCVDMHGTDALREGEDVRRIMAVAAWRESPFFTDRERAALAFTEALTTMDGHGIPDDVREAAEVHFDPKQLGDLAVAIATINVWNRLVLTVGVHAPPLAA